MDDCHNLSSPSAMLGLVTISCLKLGRRKLRLEGNLTQETRKHADIMNTSCLAPTDILQNTDTKSKVSRYLKFTQQAASREEANTNISQKISNNHQSVP